MHLIERNNSTVQCFAKEPAAHLHDIIVTTIMATRIAIILVAILTLYFALAARLLHAVGLRPVQSKNLWSEAPMVAPEGLQPKISCTAFFAGSQAPLGSSST